VKDSDNPRTPSSLTPKLSAASYQPSTPGTQSWTIARLLDWTVRYLDEKGSESPRLDAEVLLAHALGCKRIDLYTRHDEAASEDTRAKFKDLIRRRVRGCPVAYLVGRKEFFSLPFEVNPAVLIPRPDTECLVVECLRLARDLPYPRVLDIGTGSGAIAIAVAHQHRGAQVTAVDVSTQALALAKRNADRNGVADRIRFLHGDLFAPIPSGERFEFILSNPPYIARSDLPRLPAGVRDYEPLLALDGGDDGFEVFNRLVDQAQTYLASGGYLLIEIGSPQEEPARNRISLHKDYQLGKTILDGSSHPRVLRARGRI
jgi:release factor glutamine methyltransferase